MCTLKEVPAVTLVVSPMIRGTVENLLCRAEQEIAGTQYCFDYKEGVQILIGLLRRGVRIRILLDRGQVLHPSSGRQKERVSALLDNGAEVRAIRPDNDAKYGIMHAKTWLIDGEIYVGGSCNFTNNSLMNNIEHCVVMKLDHIVTTYLEWFETLWPRAADYAEVLAQQAAERAQMQAT